MAQCLGLPAALPDIFLLCSPSTWALRGCGEPSTEALTAFVGPLRVTLQGQRAICIAAACYLTFAVICQSRQLSRYILSCLLLFSPCRTGPLAGPRGHLRPYKVGRGALFPSFPCCLAGSRVTTRSSKLDPSWSHQPCVAGGPMGSLGSGWQMLAATLRPSHPRTCALPRGFIPCLVVGLGLSSIPLLVLGQRGL